MSPRPWVRVSALHEDRLARDLADLRPTHVVSLVDPSLEAHRRPRFAPEVRSFRRSFFDFENEAPGGPVHEVVRELIEFLADWARVAHDARLLTHCHMGVSRSTAAAYLAFAVHAGRGAESRAFADFLAAVNKPWPNRRMIALADELLDCGGALLGPLDAYRAANPRRTEAYARLHRWRA
jgi:predicted protein tyrosine phosphatase